MRFDDGEVTGATISDFTTTENYAAGGMIGFNMNWFQVAC